MLKFSELSFLYLEDDHDDAQVMLQLLADMGVPKRQVTVCETVDSALMALQYIDVDVVLSDYFVGRTDLGTYQTAFSFVSRIVRDYPHIPVVITSQVDSFIHQDEMNLLLKHGDVSFLPKREWSAERLIEVINSARTASADEGAVLTSG